MRLFIFVMTILVCGYALSGVAEGDEPLMALRFEDYPAKHIFQGKPVQPLLDEPRTKRFKTAIRAAAARGADFAGEFAIATHGCGTCCKGFFIVNARTGKVYVPPFYLACHYKEGVPAYGFVDLEYQLDSELLIARGARNEKGGGEYYYRWQDGELKLLKALEEVSQ